MPSNFYQILCKRLTFSVRAACLTHLIFLDLIAGVGRAAYINKLRRIYIYIYIYIRGLLEKYPTFGREKETGLLGALDT